MEGSKPSAGETVTTDAIGGLFGAGLTAGTDGIWRSREKASISFPADGHRSCLRIEEDSFWFRHRNRCIAALLKHYPIPGNGPLVDVGGGNGFVAKHLSDSGVPVVLLEPGAEGAANARKRGLTNVIRSTLEGAGFPPASLPAAGLFDVLEHQPEDLAFLKTLRSLLKRGGRLYITVPAYPWLWSAEDVFAGHHRRYTPSRLRTLADAAGFRTLFTTCFFSFLPVPILFLRSLPYRAGRRTLVRQDLPRSSREHLSGSGGLLRKAVDRLLELELGWLRAGKSIPVGGSCALVAETA